MDSPLSNSMRVSFFLTSFGRKISGIRQRTSSVVIRHRFHNYDAIAKNNRETVFEEKDIF